MADIGVRKLKTHASEIIRQVKEQRTRYVITLHGRPVAAITPIEEIPSEASNPAAWDELLALGKQIGQNWQATQTSTEILSDMRR